MTGGLLRIRDAELFWREIDKHVVVLDGRTWEYLNLNRSGGVLWKQLVEGARETQLIDHLMEIYGIDREQAERDVRAFLVLLEGKQLLTRSER